MLVLTLGDLAAVAAFSLFVAVIALPSAYLGLLAVATFLRRPPSRNDGRPAGPVRFAILVPAHDEEIMIGRTVVGLISLDYPQDSFSVHVLADNCTDATAAVALRHGARVHERTDAERRGKGAALNHLAEVVSAEGTDVDAFVVVDADTQLSSDFLRVMDTRIRGGAKVVQALNLVKVDGHTPLERIRELAFHLSCHLRPLAYATMGASSGLHGNGMCITTALCRRYAWNESTVAEDGELFLRLVRDGHRVELADDAAAYSVMPGTFRDARSQAVRWERGRFDHFRLCAGLAWRGALRRDLGQLVAGLDPLLPPFTLLAAAGVLAIVVATALGSIPLAIVASSSLLCLLLYVARGAALGRMPARTVLGILLWFVPYAAWKVWVVALAAAGVGRGKWSRTTRVA